MMSNWKCYRNLVTRLTKLIQMLVFERFMYAMHQLERAYLTQLYGDERRQRLIVYRGHYFASPDTMRAFFAQGLNHEHTLR